MPLFVVTCEVCGLRETFRGPLNDIRIGDIRQHERRCRKGDWMLEDGCSNIIVEREAALWRKDRHNVIRPTHTKLSRQFRVLKTWKAKYGLRRWWALDAA